MPGRFKPRVIRTGVRRARRYVADFVEIVGCTACLPVGDVDHTRQRSTGRLCQRRSAGSLGDGQLGVVQPVTHDRQLNLGMDADSPAKILGPVYDELARRVIGLQPAHGFLQRQHVILAVQQASLQRLGMVARQMQASNRGISIEHDDLRVCSTPKGTSARTQWSRGRITWVSGDPRCRVQPRCRAINWHNVDTNPKRETGAGGVSTGQSPFSAGGRYWVRILIRTSGRYWVYLHKHGLTCTDMVIYRLHKWTEKDTKVLSDSTT